MTDNIFYHWSPTERRKGIERLGLVPGSLSTDRAWRPPYVCLAPYPQVGWILSGNMRFEAHPSWDLWQVWLGDQTGYEYLYFDDTGNVKEIRVYERIFKRNIWHVATRERK